MTNGIYVRTPEILKNMSIAHKGQHSSPKTEFKKGFTPWNKNKPMPKGKNAYHWKGGIPKCLDCGKQLKDYHSKRCRKCMGISQRGENNPFYKGGKVKVHGRTFILKRDHPFANCHGYVRRSRLVMEKHIGRYLKPKEVVHHKNSIRDDDRPENLQLFDNHSKHQIFHKSKH